MHYFIQQSSCGSSREFEITARSANRRKVAFMASLCEFCDSYSVKSLIGSLSQDTTDAIYYRGHWLRVFTTVGPAAGAIVVEWNVREPDDVQAGAGMWDTHIR